MVLHWCSTSDMLKSGVMDNKGGHEFTTDVGRDISQGACEVVDLTSTVIENGRLTKRLIPGGSCGGNLKVPPKLNNPGFVCVEATLPDTLDMVVNTTDK